MTDKQRKPFACYLLIFLHLFLAIGALFGGGVLIISSDGSILSMPLSMLHNSPFPNFLIPGLILFVGLGILPLVTAIFLISEKHLEIFEKLRLCKDTHWSWNSSLYVGFILIIWITVELYMIQGVAFIHVFYIFLGLFIQSITLLPSVKKYYSNIQSFNSNKSK
jgi:cation transporter-like permease